MTKLQLLTYKCTRCGKLFWSYFEVIDDLDKKFIENWLWDNENGRFKDFIENQRECRRCRKGEDLSQFMDLEEDFGLTPK